MADDPTPPDPTATPAAGVRAVLDAWGQVLAPVAAAGRDAVDPKDRRFSGPEWEHPVFDLMRQGYSVMADAMMKSVDQAPGLDDGARERARFAMRTLVEAMSPANSPFTNPKALNKALDTGGASLAEGFAKMLRDFQRGQLTHTDTQAFEVGRNIATTPGKVVHETPLYQLIQYSPTTDEVAATPLVIFPPWINRFYILDLSPEKSFIRWAVEQGLTVFMVSWKSADATMKDVVWDDYIAAQIDAIDTIRDALDVKSVHTIGYCVAGTTLAATLAVLAAKGEAKKVKSATFFTAQIDFSEAGELLNFIDDAYLQLIESLSGRGVPRRPLSRDDVQPAARQGSDLVAGRQPLSDGRQASVVRPAPLERRRHQPARQVAQGVSDRPLSRQQAGAARRRSRRWARRSTCRRSRRRAYIQAGREDHIAPAESVWKITHHFAGPLKFVLAGSGHIAGVVNPPAAGKYQYWTGDSGAPSLADFVAGATEHKGSWWPDWIEWIRDSAPSRSPARVPGRGQARRDRGCAGRYVKTR